MATATGRRALHYVLKIGNRGSSIQFFRDLLGMTPLRHEEFEEGCAATCNGPYDNKWSKTMIGYGPEDDNFVLELTYNYTVGSYKAGNDLVGICAELPIDIHEKVKRADDGNKGYVLSPDGYKVFYDLAATEGASPRLRKTILAVSDIDASLKYWNGLLGMGVVSSDEGKSAVLSFGANQAQLELVQTFEKAALDRGTAFGRTAFAIPGDELKGLEEKVKAAKSTILTSYWTLQTPGKADVQVVILADPDGHEICFVGDEGFRDLSMVDPKANDLLDKALKEDGSNEWYNKKGRSKNRK